MNNTPKSKLAILLFFALCFTCNIFAQEKKMKSEFTVENGAIPKDFGKDNTILIAAVKGKRSYDKYLEKGLKKSYKGEYVLERSSNLTSKYSDREKYRYIFDWSHGYSQTTTYSDGLKSGLTLKEFYILDRLTGEKYVCGAQFQHTSKAIVIYLENLEKVRQSNQ